MQLQLKALSIPPRIKVQNKLLSVFGSTVDGKHTKDQRDARQATVGIAANRLKEGTTADTTKGKGKTTNDTKGKAKATGQQKKAFDSEDDEDDEGGGEDGAASDSSYVESDEQAVDDGLEHDGDDDGRQARARSRQENTLKRQRAFVAKNEEFNEIQKILVGKKEDGKNAALNFERSPPSFLHPWKKVSRISSDQTRIARRGLALIDWTTWEWKSVPKNSLQRVMRTFAAAAIAESATIVSYRHELILCHEDGGAATLRIRAQQVLAGHMHPRDAGETSTLVQTTLKDVARSASQGRKVDDSDVLTEGRLPQKDSITWPDGIYPRIPEGGIAQHLISVEVPRLQRERALGTQQRALQKAIDAVQNLRIAWHDPTSSANARENPPLDAEVASALQALVDVSISCS